MDLGLITNVVIEHRKGLPSIAILKRLMNVDWGFLGKVL